jgi:hypothetical protein
MSTTKLSTYRETSVTKSQIKDQPNFEAFGTHSSFKLAPERPEQFRAKAKGVTIHNSKFNHD